MEMAQLFRKGVRYLTDPDYRFLIDANLGKYDKMPDEEYLRRKFKICMGKDLDLDDPQTFNEKLQWLKLHNRKPEYTVMVDKYKVRQYIADTIGEQYLIPLLGVWDDPEDIDFDALPEQFVLKCNHNSGLGMCICKDKSRLDIPKVKQALKKGLKQDYYLTSREWPYKDVPRKIIAEKYMSDGIGEELNDYKLMCFNSKVKSTFVCSNRFSKEGLNVTFYDTDWKRMPFERYTHPASKTEIAKPKTYDEMKALAEHLAQDIPFLRVDFYEIKGKPYFGELTFFPASGFEEFNPESWDKTLGDWIKLPGGGGYIVCSDGYILWLHSSDMDVSDSLKDYKFYCFNGEPKFLYVSDNLSDHEKARLSYVTLDYQQAPFGRKDYTPFDKLPPKPEHLDEMIKLARVLAKDIPFLRVDFYEINNRVYFGELTFYPGAAFAPFDPPEWERKIGGMIRLPGNK